MFNGAFTEALLIGLAALLVLAAVIDVRTFTISNRLNLAVAALAPLYWLSIPLTPWPDVASHLAVAAGVFVLLAAAFYAGMMGGGDVKLAAALALWFSPQSTIKFLVLMSLAGGVADSRRAGLAPRQAPGGPAGNSVRCCDRIRRSRDTRADTRPTVS